MSPLEAGAVFALAAFAGTTQATTGFGFGLLIVPPLVLLLGPRDAVVLSTVLGTALSALMLPAVWHDIEWRPLNVGVVAALFGSPLGLLSLVLLDKDVLQAVIAVLVLVATGLLIRGIRVPVDPTVGPAIAGFLAGVGRMAAGLPGPPVVLYFQAADFSPRIQRGTVTAFFVVTGVVGAGLFAAQGSLDLGILALALAGTPGILLGRWAGSHVFQRISPWLFSWAVYTLLVVSALLAFASALL
jgi:uncharacterized membrane protein YfcA